MKHLFLSLVLLVLVLLAGCRPAPADSPQAGTVQPATAESTAATPTVVPAGTPIAAPTEVHGPTAVPTEVATHAPTEVPRYVGLPVEQVEALRAQCLQENPDSLCLALPVSPVGRDLPLEERSEVLADLEMPDGRVRVEDFYLNLPLPPLSSVRSLGEGEMRVFGSGPGLEGGLWGVPVSLGRNITKLDTLLFLWEPFEGGRPEIMLIIRKADGSTFRLEDVELLVGDRQRTVRYQRLARIGGENLILSIRNREPAGTLLFGKPVFESHVGLGDLLRNGFGSIVYPFSPLTEVWSEVEAYQYAKTSCRPVEIGYGEAEMIGYADELLDRAGILADPKSSADRGIYPLEGCVVVYYAPQGGQSVIAFESRNGEVLVIKTEPFEFCSIVGE